MIAILLGARRGEIIGLRWSAAEFFEDGSGRLHIQQQVRMVRGKPEVAKTKTRKSTRTIPLPPYVVEVLQEHRQRQLRQAELFNWEVTEDTWLFTTDEGQCVRPDTVYHHFKALIRKLGLSDIRFHDLRHVSASLLDDSGASSKAKADILGHTTTRMSDETYTHTSDEARRRALERAAEAFRGGAEESLGGSFGGNSENGPSA